MRLWAEWLRRYNPAVVASVSYSFDEPLEWLLAGTRDAVKLVLVRVVSELELDGHTFAAQEQELAQGMPALILGVRVGSDRGVLGIIQLEQLPGERIRLRVPVGRGIKVVSELSVNVRAGHEFRLDPDGRLFSVCLGAILEEIRRCGFLSTSSRFVSHAVLETASRELAGAEESEALAAISNVLRSAIIALANELYSPYMLPAEESEPKGDDATNKLKYVVSHYFAGKSERYRAGLKKSIDGSLEAVNALVHRKTATREEAEICLTLVSALFEMFSLIVPTA